MPRRASQPGYDPAVPTTGQPAALVTGAGSGIGRATADVLSQRGFAVALAGRRMDALRETSAALPGPSIVLAGDVGDAAYARGMVAKVVEAFGRLDVLVNNAGFAPRMTIDRTYPELLDEAFRINALGPANTIAAAWPVFVRQRSGCVVNVSSMASIDPFPGFFAYGSAKAALNLMARCCATEGRAFNVRAFAVAPGAVETPMLRANFDERAVPPGACLAPEAVAALIVDCVEGRRDADNGGVIPITAGGPGA